MSAPPRPMRLLFAPLSEAGHYTCTFRLAKLLRARGHHVAYLGIPDFEALVVGQGFAFIPFAADLLPPGYSAAFVDRLTHPPQGWRARWRQRREDTRRFEGYLGRIEGGELDGALRGFRPDLVLCDPFVWYVGLRALAMGLRVVNVSIVLTAGPNGTVPPIVSDQPPPPGGRPSLRVHLAWARMALGFLFTKRLATHLTGVYRHPTRMHHLHDVFRRLARHAGYRVRAGETVRHAEMGPQLVLPEIMLCPRALQLPGDPVPTRVYLGDIVDVERPEPPLPPLDTPPGRPLILCSLGSAAAYYPHAGRFFASVYAAAAAHPEWVWVLHLADRERRHALGPPPPNLHVLERIPQLGLLRRALVFVTHGGMNSIVEAIHFEVPMVIVPGLRDQPGNALRARRRALAVVGDMARITPEALAGWIQEAQSDDALRRGLRSMRELMEAEGGVEAALRLIEGGAAP